MASSCSFPMRRRRGLEQRFRSARRANHFFRPPIRVVPANAGIHTPCILGLGTEVETCASPQRQGLWVPAFAGTTQRGARSHKDRHTPPPGLAFGEPDDRLHRSIQYAAVLRFHHWRLGILIARRNLSLLAADSARYRRVEPTAHPFAIEKIAFFAREVRDFLVFAATI